MWYVGKKNWGHVCGCIEIHALSMEKELLLLFFLTCNLLFMSIWHGCKTVITRSLQGISLSDTLLRGMIIIANKSHCYYLDFKI